MDQNSINSLLKWGIQNSEANNASSGDPTTKPDPSRGLNAEALRQLMGGPSDADRMRESMAAIQSDEVDLENKLVAFDNMEQLIENIDNANNMESLGLWMPLTDQLSNDHPELRTMAAWCIATAIQNNPRGQERAFVIGAVPKLISLALNDTDVSTRKKAVYALSSQVRNYQPALNAMLEGLPADLRGGGGETLDAADMDAVDGLIGKLREHVQKSS